MGKPVGRPRKKERGTTEFARFIEAFEKRTGLSTMQIAEVFGMSEDKNVREWELGNGPAPYLVPVLKEWLEWKVDARPPARVVIEVDPDGLTKKHLALLEIAYRDVRNLLVLKVKQNREHDWNVLMAVLNRQPSGEGAGVQGRP